jgi:hypothetical protein
VDFEKVEKFLREHWPAGLMVAAIIAPSVWGFAHIHFGERIAILDMQVKKLQENVGDLNERVKVLDQAAARKLERSGDELRAEELFFPSPALASK